MEAVEAYPEAAEVLKSAGWKPHDNWKVYTRATLVMGFQPDGQAFHVKNWGLDVHGPDTPDDPVEAAQWLVEKFKPEPNPLTTDATLDPIALQSEEVETPQHESDGETGEEAERRAEDLGRDTSAGADGAEEQAAETEFTVDEGGSESEAGGVQDGPLDADFTIEDLGSEELEHSDLPLIEGEVEEEAPAPAEQAGGAFIFGDNLHQKRTAAIGLVWQHAALIMPPWSQDEHDILVEERNFAMGVAENRWPADPGRSSLLNAMEAELRRIHDIERARDEKIRFVNNASHEELDVFDPTQGWP